MGKKLKKFGFFDAHSEPAIAALGSLVRQSACADESNILAYLGAGTRWVIMAGGFRDLLNPSNPGYFGPYYIYTDGVWMWSTDVMYYVRKYHIELPAEFLAHMASNGWAAPSVKDLGKFER